jgi:hypothetical protein
MIYKYSGLKSSMVHENEVAFRRDSMKGIFRGLEGKIVVYSKGGFRFTTGSFEGIEEKMEIEYKKIREYSLAVIEKNQITHTHYFG